MIADNLIKCNDHFAVLAAGWRLKGKDARSVRVQVAGRFCRIAYQMVAGRMTFQHPCAQRRDYILDKLIRFSLEHCTALISSRVISTPRCLSSLGPRIERKLSR